MRIAGLDIATSSGMCWCDGEAFHASSFRPRVKRPEGLKHGEVDFTYEGMLAREFRDHLRPWLIDNQITDVGVEKPLAPNITYKKAIIDTTADWAGQSLKYEEKGATTFATIFRIYMLVGNAVELCARLNIDIHMISQGAWRRSFLKTTKAPPGAKDGTAYLKALAKKQCELAGIEIRNADQADAAGVCWHLRAMLNPRLAAVAGDLFKGAAA